MHTIRATASSISLNVNCLIEASTINITGIKALTPDIMISLVLDKCLAALTFRPTIRYTVVYIIANTISIGKINSGSGKFCGLVNSSIIGKLKYRPTNRKRFVYLLALRFAILTFSHTLVQN